MLFPLESRGHSERVASKGEVVNVLMGERDTSQLEEPLPADTLDPLTNALMLPRILGVDFHQVLDGLHDFRPARRIVGTQIDMPSPVASASGIEGHIV